MPSITSTFYRDQWAFLSSLDRVKPDAAHAMADGFGDMALGPDGTLDGTLTATLNAPGGRTITGLRLDSDAPGVWDTTSGNGWWVLGVATTLDGTLLNASWTMAVNFRVADRGSFVVFASDYQASEFLPGRTLTLTATFSDGSTATAVTTVP